MFMLREPNAFRLCNVAARQALMVYLAIMATAPLSVLAAAPVAVNSVSELRKGRFTGDVMLAGYFGAGTGGGGLLRLDATAKAADDGCLLFLDAAGHRFHRVPGAFPVTACGARGDGVADDTAAEQRALDITPAGGTVTWPAVRNCYRTRKTLVVKRSATLKGPGRICGQTESSALISISASNVTLDGLTLSGPQSSAYHANEHAVVASGLFHSGKPPENITNFTARNLTISGFGGAGIAISYLDGFSVEKTTIRDMAYAGIQGLSVLHGKITGNSISGISGVGGAASNAYGIMLSRATGDAGELVSQPRSAYVTVTGNRVSGVPTWEGLDTHSGSHIVFSGNRISDTFFGIAVVASRTAAHADYVYAPQAVTVSDNILDSGVTDGSRGTGIPFTGTSVESATGSISGNTITGYGHAGAPEDGAIRTYFTKGLTIRHNVIEAPSPTGIIMENGSRDSLVSDNDIRDPFTNDVAVASAQGIYTTGNGNSAVITGNRIHQTGKAATYVLNGPNGAAIRFGPGTDNDVRVGNNDTNAAVPLKNVGGITVRQIP